MSKVSVIIPVYNRPAELRRAVQSALRQTVRDVEVLVVDDCSEIDLPGEVIVPLYDSRVHYFRLDKKGNANVCRNLGIREAKGQYIAMLDSDDEWLDNHLEKRIELIEKTNADGLFGSHVVDNGSDRKVVISRNRNSGESMADYLLTNGTAVTPSHFYKAECAKAIDWDESLKRHQDFDFSIRFAERFSFQPCTEATCIVHWVKGERRTENFESQMRFIEKHKTSISPHIYAQYHYRGFFQAVGRAEVSPDVVRHYRVESLRYIHQISFVDYLSVAGYGKSSITRLFLRLKFAALIILKNK